jgi:hypothetical protein
MQVSQTKFTSWKIMQVRILVKLPYLTPKGLNPFKIQGIFKLEFVPQFSS